MSKQNNITACCSIKSGKVMINNCSDFESKSETLSIDFFKTVYKHYQFNYPKFYKMDNLCKLAFIASELLLRKHKITDNYKEEDIGIVISNNASSLDIDTEHQQTISDKNNYFPSPSVFVYTLPNILIGEIAIRNKIKGENTFFIFDKFDASFMSSYVNTILNTNNSSCCISGWVNYYLNDYEAFLYIVEKNIGTFNFRNTEEELNKLYINQK